MGLSAAARAAERVLELQIVGRRIGDRRPTIRATAGDRIELRWTTDEATIVHLHGYDLELPLEPGTEGRMRFEAYATGRFPVSAHGFGAVAHTAAQREIVLLYLEVQPR